MEAEEQRPDCAEDILPRDLAQQNPSQGNRLGLEDGKNVETLENVYSQEKMELEVFAKPDNTVSSSCGIQADCGVFTGTGKKECHPNRSLKNGSAPHCLSPKEASPQSLGLETGHASTSLNESLGELPSLQVVRRSLSCYSPKPGTKRRKSLTSLYKDVSELSKAISLDLPEADRMATLLFSSFQYSAQKLEHFLRQTKDFNPETFKQNVSLLSEELRLHTKKLGLDGSLQKCFEDPRRELSDPAWNASVTYIKEEMARLSAENQAWEELLQSYQKNAEEMSRQLELCKLKQVPKEPLSYLGASQAHVLQAKPDYQKVLDCQREIFYCLEFVLDEIHQMVKVCQTYMEDVTQYLQKLSAQLASRTFQRLESSPARKLLRLLQTQSSAPPPPQR
ncbi:kinetochore-associated protein DSN1 homolog [Elgaria multicarinata webbii]|uniref:kinetochore-associated protein DSN1 homolog n=1 Tax=Elgaria multicarinata webbii TaxID=159646 RepID=UPI002FCD3973